MDGEVKPVITTVLWGTKEGLFSNHSFSDFLENGGHCIENQLSSIDEAMQNWDEYYEFHDGQEALIGSLFQRKLKAGFDVPVYLTTDEGSSLYGDIEECKKSLGELHIIC